MRWSLTCLALAVTTLLGPRSSHRRQRAKRRYILATGRRLPYVYVVSLDAALDPANDRTSKAIVGRSKVATDALDGRLLGDPANLVVSEDGRTVYVVNHHGAIDNAEFRQHGGRGQIAVLDIDDLLAPRNDRTANALRRHMDSGGFGALGIVLLPEMLVIANAENHLTEDGGNRITFVDRRTGSLRGTVELALGSPGFPCPDYPVPYVRAVRAAAEPGRARPGSGLWMFPEPERVGAGPRHRWQRLCLLRKRRHERRVGDRPRSCATRGHCVRRSVASRCRSARGASPRPPTGGTSSWRTAAVSGMDPQATRISVIDVDRARAGAGKAEVARVLVGTDDPLEQTHPLIPIRHARRPGSGCPERAREQRVDREPRAGARRQS